MKKKTLEQFVEQANLIHNNFYDYSLIDIYVNTHMDINIICPLHGKFLSKPYKHLQQLGCPKCAPVKRKQTCLKKYGVDNPRKSPDVVEKIKQTNLQRYGAYYPYQTKELWDKRTNTMIERYGVEHSVHSVDIQNKIKSTNLKKYGVEYAAASDIVRNKIKETCNQLYGGNAPASSDLVIEKMKTSTMSKYGVPNIKHLLITSDTREKLNDYNWLYEQYIILNKTALQLAKELGINDGTIRRYLDDSEITIKNIFVYSHNSINWLSSISTTIQHALNGGEYRIPGTRYRADGYCATTNTIYEFHGDYWHGNPSVYAADEYNTSTKCTMGELYQRTTIKEDKIRELEYNLVTIWESDWNKIKS